MKPGSFQPTVSLDPIGPHYQLPYDSIAFLSLDLSTNRVCFLREIKLSKLWGLPQKTTCHMFEERMNETGGETRSQNTGTLRPASFHPQMPFSCFLICWRWNGPSKYLGFCGRDGPPRHAENPHFPHPWGRAAGAV